MGKGPYPLVDFVSDPNLPALLIHGPTDQASVACGKILDLSYTAADIPLENLQKVETILKSIVENTRVTRPDVWHKIVNPYNRIASVVLELASRQMNASRSWTDDATD